MDTWDGREGLVTDFVMDLVTDFVMDIMNFVMDFGWTCVGLEMTGKNGMGRSWIRLD